MFSVFAGSLMLFGFQTNANMEVNGPFDRAVPQPESTLGYRIGARITTYRDQERAMESMAQSSGGKAKRIDYGMSNDRLPLRVYAISSAKNIARLDAIHKAIEKSATTGVVPTADIPAIVWVNETIHGNEPASFEAGMMLMYNLVAGKGAFAKALDNIVVILNPCYNPDGHERYAVTYNSYAKGDYAPGSFETFEASLFSGRLNHYRFDMNRDRVSFSQKETREEVALMQSWRPQVYLDQHGQVSNYFFPPNPMSINANVDRNRLNKWTDIMGRASAKAFDKVGWSYFIKDEFDLYYPGYLDSHTTLSGAIGMTHETDGGKELAKTRDDGSIVTLREGAAKHMTTALACIQAASERKQELVADWASYKRKAVTGEFAGAFKRVIFKSTDVFDLVAIKDQLLRTGVQSKIVDTKATLKGTSFWTKKDEDVSCEGPTLIVDMAQEYGPIAKALIESNSDFEKEFVEAQMKKKASAPEGENYPGQDGTEFYDLTGWALPFSHNVQAWWTADTQALPESEKGLHLEKDPATEIGYVIPYTGQNAVLAAADLAAAGVKVSFMRSDMKLGGKTFDKGSFVIFKVRNDANVVEKIFKVASKRTVPYFGLPTSYPDSGREGPGNKLNAVLPPKIGLVFGNGAQMTGVSGVWYTLDDVFKLPYVSLSGGALNSNSILNSYTVLLAPRGSNAASNSKVKEWVREGGVLVVFEENPASIASFTNGPETRDLPGTIFRAKLDGRSVLSYGYKGDEIAVPVSGSSFPKARKEGGGVVKFSDDMNKLLTGWSWGEESEKALQGSVWLHDEPTGRGHIVWFAQDPCDRAMWPGLHKLLLNSMILLPGN
jgi:hypothetical protein